MVEITPCAFWGNHLYVISSHYAGRHFNVFVSGFLVVAGINTNNLTRKHIPYWKVYIILFTKAITHTKYIYGGQLQEKNDGEGEFNICGSEHHAL